MRFLFCLLLAGGLQTGWGQGKMPAIFHQRSFARDTLFKKTGAPLLVRETVYQRALRTSATCAATCFTLPVKFLSIEGERANDSTVWVKWEASTEIENRGYAVERSLGDTRNFHQTGFVNATNTMSATEKFTFKDHNEYPGISFYRVKQISQNGEAAYSKIVAVKGYSKTEALEVFPNPVHNKFQLSLNLQKAGMVGLALFDGNGRRVKEQRLPLTKGANLFTWDVHTLAPGTYLLRAFTPAEKTLTLKLIKN